MKYILDTGVIASSRRADRAPRLAAWLKARHEEELFLSVVSISEIALGIHLQEAKDPDAAGDLRRWLERTVTVFADRVLAFSAQDAMVWGVLSARIGPGPADLMIAAQALTRDAVVVTANGADFARAGVRVFDPF
ncbi:type II toxin-antitoxin system VapC family toxin [Seohaeicola zhoushanensis]|uniref:Ribonuclease VapC n=1 Tax=Seohaeicola zhoushanensis TaxID=1569283 RepID=A0A8J3M9B9_9RHOB|nr:type II toxin-antitoxin system VapC family toxin [Seohaeicola zhoushanensis]GHF47965.1 ribonuclease VapC [Seohaeicola zhoushanensis]